MTAEQPEIIPGEPHCQASQAPRTSPWPNEKAAASKEHSKAPLMCQATTSNIGDSGSLGVSYSAAPPCKRREGESGEGVRLSSPGRGQPVVQRCKLTNNGEGKREKENA